MANGVRADGSRATLGMGTPSPSSLVCDWTRPRATVQDIPGRRAGKGELGVRLASRPGIPLGCKASGPAAAATTGPGKSGFPGTLSATRALIFPTGIEWERIDQLRPKRNKTCSKLTMAAVCMTPPSESSSGHIDMFRVRQKPPELPDRSLPPAVYVVPQYPRYHSVQLALVIVLFACGGLICSMLLVDGSDDFPRSHYWPRKS